MIKYLKRKARTSNAALYALAAIYGIGILAFIGWLVVGYFAMWILWGYGA